MKRRENTPKRKGTSESCFLSKHQHQIHIRAKHLLQYRKKRSETKTQTAIVYSCSPHSARSSPPHSKVPPVNVQCSHSQWHSLQVYKPETVHDKKWNYIYKKPPSSSVKTVISFKRKKKKNHHIIFIIQKVLLATSKENQWSKCLKLTVPIAAQCHNSNKKALHLEDS